MVNLSTSVNTTSTTTTKYLGTLQFTVEYIPTLLQLKIHLLSATSLPAFDSNGLSDPYVKLHLLPGIAKVIDIGSNIFLVPYNRDLVPMGYLPIFEDTLSNLSLVPLF